MRNYNEMKSETFSQSDPKRKILYYLKVMKLAGLKDLSKVMKISRMAVHKHLSDLQDRRLVESAEIRKGVGRPTMQYSLTSTGKTAFPKSYGEIATHALDYVEKKMGKDAVESVLRERQKELIEKYSIRMKDMKFNEKVKELARIRDEEGYIAESKKDRKRNSHTLLEYNCPIIMIAEKHWEACSIETELFEHVLDAKVEVTHRAAKGDSICKFLIKEKSEYL
jgi:predicted ArsR family transcriptional regulator